jgi:DNA invertase Pin-like site-specific DNA recombinase
VLLRKEAQRAGDTMAKEYVGEKPCGNANRPGIQQMLLDADKRRFDVVLATQALIYLILI